MQADKGVSSVRLAEALGVSLPTAWRIGHAVRLLMTREQQFGGTVEIDEFYIGGSPRKDADRPRLGRGRKGQPRTAKTPVLAVVQRPEELVEGAPAGEARAKVVDDLSESEARRVLAQSVDPSAHLMSDEWKSILSIGEAFAAHDTVRHSEREYARGTVHANSAEGFNDRVRRTVLSPECFITSARAMPIFISLRLPFDGPSEWWLGEPHVARAKDVRSSGHCGPGSGPPSSSKRCSDRPWAVSSGELAAAASSSNPP